MSPGKSKFVWLSIGLALGFWFVDSAIDWLFFGGISYQESFFGWHDLAEIWMRFLVMTLLVCFGVYAQWSFNKQKQLENGYNREITERQTVQDMLAANEQAISRLYNIVSDTSLSFEQRVQRLLLLGSEQFSMPIGILSHIENDNYIVIEAVSPDNSIVAGQTFTLGDTYCEVTLRTEHPVCFESAADTQWQSHPAYQKFNLIAYMGARVMVNNIIYGTLNFSSPAALSDRLSKTDLDFLQLMATWIGEELSHKEANDRVRQDASVFNNIHEGIIITDHEDKIIRVNNAFTKITGYLADEVISKNPRLLWDHQHDDNFYEHINKSLRMSGDWQGEAIHRHKNGELYPVSEYISVLRDEAGVVKSHVYVFINISMYKETETRLSQLAYQDPLTKLPNRLALFPQIDHAISLAHRNDNNIYLLFIDLDKFKYVNDSLGHDLGDEVLRQLAQRLQDCLRESDMIARYGGDEFVAVLDGSIDSDDVEKLTEKIINNVSRKLMIGDKEINISVSIGISTYPGDAADSQGLLNAADSSMYQCKKNGRNQYQFYTAQASEGSISQ